MTLIGKMMLNESKCEVQNAKFETLEVHAIRSMTKASYADTPLWTSPNH